MDTEKINKLRDDMNFCGENNIPFFFMTDFELDDCSFFHLASLPGDIRISMPHFSNAGEGEKIHSPFSFNARPVSFEHYEKAFGRVIEQIRIGNSYLLNLTFPTEIVTTLTPLEIFNRASAKHKLLYRNEFVVFSPETFVTVEDDVISSFPMKGTIRADSLNAEKEILENSKEIAEHSTIVDLIRNDLSIIADEVHVPRFRYTDLVTGSAGDIIQVSSEIRGKVMKPFRKRFGDIIIPMLPAGSVSGAPKRETLRIIKEAEEDRRGWYTGVFGVYNGKKLDTAVMIRFIEKKGDKMIFRSGGGITHMSDARAEYDEMIAKVYLPFR